MKNRRIPWILIAAGMLLFIAGIYNGDPGKVMLKGIRICLECIGIG